ncbi:zinc-ribbon domain-containing protein [Butyrivibrio fibrisolvens]|uniref:zinc-ribbon domain-containing protein n=1 Tax=Butyrivibrio fibrisolvens TaxID=831 RepID=UPI0003FA50CF
MEEWNYNKNSITPDEISAHNNKIKVWWKCKTCGYEWELSVAKRVDRGDGCPCCSGKRVIKGKNDLDTVYPECGKWWSNDNDKKPEDYFPFSHARVKWRCLKCGYAFYRIVSDHVKMWTCPCCTDSHVIVGKNDLQTRQPILIEEWNYKRNQKGPECYKEHSNKKVWWLCSYCGYEWRAIINNRSKGEGCPRCNRGYASGSS